MGIIGFCKECANEIRVLDRIDGYERLYECPNCGHPHDLDEILPVSYWEDDSPQLPQDTYDGGIVDEP